MSSLCNIEFYYNPDDCPCQYAPEFKRWERDYNRERAIEETQCIPEEQQLTTLPIVSDASDVIDFNSTNLTEAADSFFLVIGLIVAIRLIFK